MRECAESNMADTRAQRRTNYPLVSICVPCLNTVKALPERVDSILRQTYENLEIIIVDGYSDDGSWEFWQEVIKQDRRCTAVQAPRGRYFAIPFIS